MRGGQSRWTAACSSLSRPRFGLAWFARVRWDDVDHLSAQSKIWKTRSEPRAKKSWTKKKKKIATRAAKVSMIPNYQSDTKYDRGCSRSSNASTWQSCQRRLVRHNRIRHPSLLDLDLLPTTTTLHNEERTKPCNNTIALLAYNKAAKRSFWMRTTGGRRPPI